MRDRIKRIYQRKTGRIRKFSTKYQQACETITYGKRESLHQLFKLKDKDHNYVTIEYWLNQETIDIYKKLLIFIMRQITPKHLHPP